jgi:AcrR family transcriptional regulator
VKEGEMPPKTKFTKNEVIKAAVSVVEKKGLNALTARNVAIKLGSSTAPVYSHFKHMSELARCVMRETQQALLEYSRRPYTDRVFLNMGTGIGMFACEHRRLYRALMLEGDNYGDVVTEILDTLEAELKLDQRFESLTDLERRVLLRKMWTFTHGMASLICVGLVKDCSLDYITKTLIDVGTDVIGATMAKHKSDTKSE